MRPSFRTVCSCQLNISCRIFAMLILLGLCVVAGGEVAPKAVLTWHYSNLRTGANTVEVALTPATVNYKTFGKLSTKPVDGYVAAQPLYVPNVTIAGQAHNVVFVTTLHDSV